MSFYKEVPGRQTTLESTLKFDNEPKAGSTNPVTSDGVKGAISKSVENSLDDHDPAETVIYDVSKKFYDEHELGYYYALGDKIYLCTEHTRSGDPDAYTYSTILTKLNGIVPVLNRLVDEAEVVAAALNDLDARLKAIESVDENLGDVVADSINVQTLLLGGEDVGAMIGGKADKVSNAMNNHFAALDSNGNLKDSGTQASDFAPAAQVENN